MLIGRAAELAVISALVDEIQTGGSALVVVGEAGIGKSSLLRVAGQHARTNGCALLEIVGVESETRLPFAGLHQLLRPILSDLEMIPSAHQSALRSTFGLQEGPPAELFLTALAALSLLTEVAVTRPVAIVVDDLQWVDESTREVLAFLGRRIDSDPIVILGARRLGYPDPFAGSTIEVLEVSGLDDSGARELLDQCAADLSTADQEVVLRQAIGNPLALVELSAALRGGAPSPDVVGAPPIPLTARLERAFAARINELPQLTRDAMLVAAVDPEGDTAEVLAAAGLLSGAIVTLGVFQPAVAIGMIDSDPVRIRFRHPLMRSGTLQSEPGHRQQAAHAALAAILHQNPYRRTSHRAQAVVGPDDEVANDLELSSVESMRRGDVAAAISALERSAQLSSDLSTRGRRLLLAAERGWGLGRVDIVDRLITTASALPLADLDQARMEWLREIFNDGVPGDAARVLELCSIARASADAGDTELALHLLVGAALRCWWANTGPEARARVASVTLSLTGSRGDARYIAALAIAEPVLQARTVLDLLSTISVESVHDANALRLLGQAAHAVGDQPRAIDFLARAEKRLRGEGRLGLLSKVLGVQGVVLLDLGDWAGSDSAIAEGRQLAADTDQPIWNIGPLLNMARSAGLHGDSRRGLELAEEAEQSPMLRSWNFFLASAQLARGFSLITAGRHAQAFDALRRVFDPADPAHHLREQFCGIMFLAEAGVHADQREDARRIVADMEALARVTPSPLLAVQLLYARAVLADDGIAEQRYREGLAADLTRWPWVRARIQFAYGAWLRRQRRVAESREPMRQALAVFTRIGARSWAEQAQTELRAAGERRMASKSASADLLSPQELQIAGMAAQGLSNREIGQQLFLSPRTIGSHLYRVFPKLDITSRHQLAERLSTQ